MAAVLVPVIHWKGYAWSVKSGSGLGPGPDNWDPANVFVDSRDDLHLRIARSKSGWTCAEVDTTAPLGFGTYQWQVTGRVDKLDRNVVLGLFGYNGPDGNNEIDVEFAAWSRGTYPKLDWTVWPASGSDKAARSFPFMLHGTYTTSRYTWTSQGVRYLLMGGHQPIGTEGNVLETWDYRPSNPRVAVPQAPMALCMNLWLFENRPPSDGNPVEIVIHDFKKL